MTNPNNSIQSLKKKKDDLLKEANKLGTTKVERLRRVNQGWNIGLTVAGITCTLLTTTLGVIEVPKHEWLVKFGVALTGAGAVATQTANREFRVRGKAGEYAGAEAELSILRYKIPRVTDEASLKGLEEELHKLRRAIAVIESKDPDVEDPTLPGADDSGSSLITTDAGSDDSDSSLTTTDPDSDDSEQL